MSFIQDMAGDDPEGFVNERVEHLIEQGLVHRVGDRLYLTDYGLCMVDEMESRGILTRIADIVKLAFYELLYYLFFRKHHKK